MNVAVIPARGGSKRIPRKNIREFCGKPMIAWTIETAIKCGYFSKIIVSTDDTEIAEVAREYGAEVPFIRPDSLSDDHSGTLPVVQHAIEWLKAESKIPDYVCCIYATAPFVQVEDLRQGFEMLVKEKCNYVFSVTSFAFPIQRALWKTEHNRVAMFQPEHLNTRSQDLKEAYHDAGQFYWGARNAWLEGKGVFEEDSVPVLLPRYRVQDIDTTEDWVRAEYLFRILQQEQLTGVK